MADKYGYLDELHKVHTAKTREVNDSLKHVILGVQQRHLADYGKTSSQ